MIVTKETDSLKGCGSREIRKAPSEMPLREVARLMRQFKTGSLIIEEGGHYTGIVSEGDIVRRAVAQGATGDLPVKRFMTTPMMDIDVNESPIVANHRMYFNGIRHLALSENGHVIGVISVRDLVYHFSNDPASPLNALNDIYQPVAVLAHREIQQIESSASIQAVAQKMVEKKVGSLLVILGERYVGIVTETDIVRRAMADQVSILETPVRAIMSYPILGVDLSAPISEVSHMMAANGVRHLAVTDFGKIIGILSVRDLIGMVSIRDLPRFFSGQY